jgi:hypothetical protein
MEEMPGRPFDPEILLDEFRAVEINSISTISAAPLPYSRSIFCKKVRLGVGVRANLLNNGWGLNSRTSGLRSLARLEFLR